MAHNDELKELDDLKIQFGYLNEKLEKHSILKEKMLSEIIGARLNRMERWYRNRFAIYLISPILAVNFIKMDFHWGFIALFTAITLAGLVLDIKCYRTLNPKELATLPMTQASENVAKHKYWRVMTDRIMIFPLILLLGWTAMIASGYTFNAAMLFLMLCFFAGGIIWGVKQQKTNMKKLDEAMEAIRDLKG